jgi:hypothetical protein
MKLLVIPEIKWRREIGIYTCSKPTDEGWQPQLAIGVLDRVTGNGHSYVSVTWRRRRRRDA